MLNMASSVMASSYFIFEADKNAISPLLDLFNFYKYNNHIEMKKIVSIIFSSPTLLGQLDTHEIEELKTTITEKK